MVCDTGPRKEGHLEGTDWDTSWQLFPQHIFHCLSSYHHDVSQFQSSFYNPLHRWCAVCLGLFYEEDGEGMLSLECEVIRVNIMHSRVERPNADLCVFSARAISKVKTIGAYYSPFTYTDLPKQTLPMKEYGEGTTGVKMSTFFRCAMVLHDALTECCGCEQSYWIVLASFCEMGYNNDARYLTWYTTPTIVKQLSPLLDTNLFKHKEASVPYCNVTNLRIIAVVAEKQIVVGESYSYTSGVTTCFR